MTFQRYNEDGTVRRNQVGVDFSNDKIIVEQHHKDTQNVNNIIKRHGMDMIAKTAALQQPQYIMDDNPNNDFQEAMQIVTAAQQHFDVLPSEIRKKFNNSPAEFLDFVHNPDNSDEMVKLGLAQRIEKAPPIEVAVMNQTTETPPDSGAVV